jgi:hypothetical protein
VNEPGSEGGWNVAKVLGLIIGLIGMVGFGVCGLCGLAISFGGVGSDTGFVLFLSFGGLALGGLFFLLVRAMIRSARRKPPGSPGP